jgi:phosphatidate cytidylyltransferase
MPTTTTTAAAPAKPLSKGAVFLRRLGTSVVLWTLVVSALFSENKLISDSVFLAVMLFLVVFGMREFYGIVEKRDLVCFSGLGIAGGAFLLVSTFIYLSGNFPGAASPGKANDFESSILIIFVLGLCLRQFVSKTNTAGILAISTTLFGLMYVAWLLNFIQKINFFPNAGGQRVYGHYYVLYFIVVTKCSDIGAYCIGSVFGRHKMIPRISPGKTWEGFGGAILVSAGASLLFAHFTGAKLTGMTPLHATIIGVVLGGAAVVGDLIESLFKREAGLKDSGKLFPGIGGILDLMDSLLFNAPLMYLYLRHILTP